MAPRQYYVLPSEAGRRCIVLRASEMLYTWVPAVPIGYVFDELLDPEHVQAGLEAAVAMYPVVAGRFGTARVEGVTRACVRFDQGCRGCVFQVEESDCKTAPESAETVGTDRSWQPFVVSGLSRLIMSEIGSREPLFRAKLTLLRKENKSVLTMSFAHCIFDGASIMSFLQAWSHLSGQAALGKRGKKVLLMPEDIGHLKTNQPPNRSLEQYDSALDEKLSRSDLPFSQGKIELTSFVPTVVRVGARSVFDTRSDFLLNMDDVKRVKNAVAQELPPKAWVSSYEVIMAMVLQAQAVSEGRKTFKTRILANTRGRERYSPKEYEGNALSFIPITLEIKDRPLSDIALQIHAQLRERLANSDELEKLHLQYEKAVRCNSAANNLARLRYYHPWFETETKKSPICNSWVGYDWFGLSFGGTSKPVLMNVPKEFSYHRHIFVYPRTETQLVLRMQMPASDLARFQRTLCELGLPFRPLDSKQERGAAAKAPALAPLAAVVPSSFTGKGNLLSSSL